LGNILIRKFTLRFDKTISWILKYNLQVILFFALFLILFEFIEPIYKNQPLDIFHGLETLFYVSLLILVRILILYLVDANAEQKRILEILRYKHEVSLELTKSDTWETLKAKLTRIPNRIVAVETSQLYIYNFVSNQLEMVECWHETGIETADFQHNCDQHIKVRPKDEFGSGLFISENTGAVDAVSQEFCVPINFGEDLIGLLQVRLKLGHKLTAQQIDIFEKIRPEISLILKISQEQQALSELLLTKRALVERRTVSNFIHDQLGQNLGYLHLKLDLLVENNKLENTKEIRTELKQLRDVANKSYGIVRDILKSIQSETVPNISNLLREQAETISSRANFEFDFRSMGEPVPLLPAVQQSVFFTFSEILSNIERHANASRVEILVVWNDGILDVSVSDNGTGFDPKLVPLDDHFGLYIMRERMASINGNLVINSSTESGTIISLSVPIQSIERAAVV
jgi:nitrate/nitrite-specific signal transduction histidine kinase